MIGKENSAYYMFGIVKNSFIFLDPHKVRKGNKVMNYEISEFYSINFEDLHPNISITFLLENNEDLENFCKFVKEL